MLKVKNTLVLAGLFTALPVICLAGIDSNDLPGGGGGGVPGYMQTLMKSVLMIIVLGGVAFYISKKFMPKLRPSVGRDINIRETIHLGPNKTVHLIEVGEKTFLVGSTSENISMLADVTETLDAGGDDAIN